MQLHYAQYLSLSLLNGRTNVEVIN